MLGQHIFVRCKNGQGHAGTWTADMTPNIVDKEVVKNFIEPRCNIEEAFAYRTMVNGNNVLRIYRVGDSIVVTRTFWESDRLTDASSRKGAYSVSYIVTDEEIKRYAVDFGGAFAPTCFETYNDLVERVGSGLVKINGNYDLFTHPEFAYDSSIFAKVGINDKKTFITFMNGIYTALEENRQLAVLLPASLRSAWEENGDDTAEKFAFNVMTLLPPLTRVHFGMASHWGCQLNDIMVSDMHLIMVHPEKVEDLGAIKREGIMLLDLDTGAHTANIEEKTNAYFEFVWNSLNDLGAVEAYWESVLSRYRKLLRLKPRSIYPMECVFLMDKVLEEKYSDRGRLLRAFLIASGEFAGAGTLVPDAEEFLTTSLQTLKFTPETIDAKVEEALCKLMVEDIQPTKHQAYEYAHLLSLCEVGKASDNTVEALCNEIDKEERAAANSYDAYLKEKSNIAADKITVQMVKFLCGLFSRLVANEEFDELFQSVVDCMKNWSSALISAGNADLLMPFIESSALCLKKKSVAQNVRKIACNFLFECEKAIAKHREVCSELLFREEKRVYNAIDASDVSADERLQDYASKFFEILTSAEIGDEKLFGTWCERFFRLAFVNKNQVGDNAIVVYKTLTERLKNDSGSLVSVVLASCENVLTQIAEMPSVWDIVKVGDTLLLMETLNMHILEQYIPSAKHIDCVMPLYNKEKYGTYFALEYYVRKTGAEARNGIYKAMAKNELLSKFFLHLLYTGKAFYAEPEALLRSSHSDKVKGMMASKLLVNKEYATDDAKNYFKTWYTESLKKEIVALSNEEGGSVAVINRVLAEYGLLSSVATSPLGFNEVAKAVLDSAASNVFASIRDENITLIDIDVINRIINISEGFADDKKPANLRNYQLVQHVDNVFMNKPLEEIDAVCSRLESDEDKKTVCLRLRNKLLKITSDQEKTRCFWIYYFLVKGRIQNANVFAVNDYISARGYNDLADTDVCSKLVELLLNFSKRASGFERMVANAVLAFVYDKVARNPQAFEKSQMFFRLDALREKDYFISSDLYAMWRAHVASRSNLRFDGKMLGLCLAASVICFGIGILAYLMLSALCKSSTALMFIVGISIFAVLVAVDILLFPKKKKDRSVPRGGQGDRGGRPRHARPVNAPMQQPGDFSNMGDFSMPQDQPASRPQRKPTRRR